MKKGKIFQVITAILLAIALVVTGIYHPYLFGDKDGNAQASDGLTEISWEDFEGVQFGKTYSTQWDKFTYKDKSVTTLNNTRFTGLMQFSDPSGIRYGGSSEYFGLHLTVISGNLYLWSETFNLADITVDGNGHHVRPASDFGIASGSFVGETIKLTITMTNVTETTATVGVWINDIAVDDSFAMTSKDANTYKFGTSFCIMDGNTNGPVTVLAPLPPTGLTEIGWRNFGIKTEYTYDNHTSVTYTGGDTLDGTLFSGDIKAGNTDSSQKSEIRYAASQDGNFGLHICVEGGLLYIKSDTMDVVSGLENFIDSNWYPVYYYASNYGVGDSFSNATFNLKISTEIEGSNYTFGIWINDIMVGSYFTLTPSATYPTAGGNQIGLDCGGTGFVTVYPEEVVYKDISWRDFEGADAGTYTNAWHKFTYKDKNVNTLNNTRFSGRIMLSDPSGIRYGGSGESFGLQLTVISGNLYLWSETFDLSDITVDSNGHHVRAASDFGIASGTFKDEPIELTITMADVTETTATVGVWINNIAVDDSFTMTSKDANTYKFGTSFCIMDGNTGGAVTVVPSLPPIGLTEIGWEDFGITEETTYESHTTVTYANGDSLNGTLFSGDITMNNQAGGESEIRYAASESGWWGLHIQVDGNGELWIKSDTMVPASGSSTTYAGPHKSSDFGFADGTTFTNTRFNLKISTEIEDSNYTFGVWINDIMAGDYFTLTPGEGFSGAGGNLIGLKLDKVGTVTAHIDQEVPELVQIDWSDFGVSYGSKYTAWQEVSYTGGSLNNTVFEDYVIMTENAQFGYAASMGWDGLFIGLNEAGNLLIKSDTCGLAFETSGEVIGATAYEPSAFGLTQFVNTKFRLKIETTKLTKTSAKFRVWVNDVLFGDDAIIGTVTDTANYGFGNRIGLQRSNSGTMYAPAVVAVPEGLTTVTWEDFGIAANSTYQLDGTLNTIIYGSAPHFTDLNNTLFVGDVVMSANSHFRYGGKAGDFGLHVGVTSEGELQLRSDTFGFENGGKTYAPELFGIDSFIDAKFNIKIAMTDVTEATATVCVWINDEAVCKEFVMTSTNADVYKTGNCLALYNGTITVYTMFKEPTGLPTMAFKDFNNNGINSSAESAGGAAIENGTYGRNWIKAVYSESTLLNKSFRDTVRMEPYEDYSETYYYTLQYGGSTSYGQDGGIRISLVGDNLVIHPAVDEFSGVWTLYPDKVGLQSFARTEFQLGIDAVEYGDHVLLWLYFDGKCYNNAPFLLVNFASKMTNTLMVIAGNKTTEAYLADRFVIGATMKTLTSVHHDLKQGGYELPSGLNAISGKTYDGKEMDTSAYGGGSSITKPGIYEIQFNDGISLYTQTIYLAMTGDNNCNGKLDSCDLVRLAKTVRIADYEFQEGAKGAADIDNNGYLNEEDVKTMRIALVSELSDSSVMPIVGFRGPSNELVTDEMFELIAKAGINTIIQYENHFSSVSSDRYQVYEQLTMAQNHNIKLTVSDAELRENPASVTANDVTNAVSQYNGFQSYAGLWLVDEPVSNWFPYSGSGQVDIRQIDYYANLALHADEAGERLFGNLEPYHYTNGDENAYHDHKASGYMYKKHLEYYVDKLKPSEISYTYYPFDQDKTKNGVSGDVEGASQYFQNLLIARTVADDAGIPFWSFVQAGSNWNDDATGSIAPTTNNCPTRGEFKWNANTALAFGAKGIQYFPLIQPEFFANTTGGSKDYKRNGLLGANGEPTSWYAYAQEVNAQIAAVDHVLMNATNEGLMSTGGYAKSQATDVVASMILYEKTSDSWYQPSDKYTARETLTTTIHTSYANATVSASDATYGALTGCFATGDGQHALYIVNYNPSSDNTITVNFGSNKAVSIVTNAVAEEMTTSVVTKTLGAGEAMLIVY